LAKEHSLAKARKKTHPKPSKARRGQQNGDILLKDEKRGGCHEFTGRKTPDRGRKIKRTKKKRLCQQARSLKTGGPNRKEGKSKERRGKGQTIVLGETETGAPTDQPGTSKKSQKGEKRE